MFNIQPKKSFLADAALGVSSFLGGYGQGRGQNASAVVAAGNGAAQAIQNAGSTFAPAFTQAYANSFDHFARIAQQQQQYDNATNLQNSAHAFALQEIGARGQQAVDTYYQQRYGMSSVNAIQDAAAQNIPVGQYLQNIDNQRMMSAHKAQLEANNLEMQVPQENLDHIANLQGIKTSLAADPSWSPDQVALASQEIDKQIQGLSTPIALPKKPRPQTAPELMQSGTVMRVGNDYFGVQPDGKWSVQRGSGMKAGDKPTFYERAMGGGTSLAAPGPQVPNVGGGAVPGIASPGGAAPAQAPGGAAPQQQAPSGPPTKPADVQVNQFTTSRGDVDWAIDDKGVPHDSTKRAELHYKRLSMAAEVAMKAAMSKNPTTLTDEFNQAIFDKVYESTVAKLQPMDRATSQPSDEPAFGIPLPAQRSELKDGKVYQLPNGIFGRYSEANKGFIPVR